ncbi:hypothetical protein HPB50_020687 [Hyalomma asiaticum]|uniref:Uncharacterized protein n=1 Tax=Hyalomma asiaticum TaxID=266040 RepID=A0ACB7S572_HYAAI|nr:hypothetical protein HPB50_020687 [Hyalomma asiaticum]
MASSSESHQTRDGSISSSPVGQDGHAPCLSSSAGSTPEPRASELHAPLSVDACVGTSIMGGTNIGTAIGSGGTADPSMNAHLTSTAMQVFVPFILAGIGSTMAGILLDVVKVATIVLERAPGLVMSTVVVMSTKCEKNPENIAPAIAASFGDLTTLFLLSAYSSFLLQNQYLAPLVIVVCVVLLPVWIILARRNSVSREVLRVGWLPIITALTISSFGGYILDYAVIEFPPIALHLSSVNDLAPLVIVVCVVLLPVWIILARRNSVSREVLRVGWLPIITALTISRLAATYFVLLVEAMKPL